MGCLVKRMGDEFYKKMFFAWRTGERHCIFAKKRALGGAVPFPRRPRIFIFCTSVEWQRTMRCHSFFYRLTRIGKKSGVFFANLRKDGVITNDVIDSLGRNQTLNFINEPKKEKGLSSTETLTGVDASNFGLIMCRCMTPQFCGVVKKSLKNLQG